MEFSAGAVVRDTEMVRLESIIGYGRHNVGVTVTQGSSLGFADEAHYGMLYGLRRNLSVLEQISLQRRGMLVRPFSMISRLTAILLSSRENICSLTNRPN